MKSPTPGVAYAIAPFFSQQVFPNDLHARVQKFAQAVNAPGPLPEGAHPEITCLLGGWGIPRLDEAVLQRLPNLKAVFYAAGSIRSFMTESAWERGIVVSTAADENNAAVAEYCVGAVLFSLKHGWRLARDVRSMRGFPAHQLSVPGIYGGRVGLVSFGRIARKLCAHLRSFPLQILVWDPYVDPAEIEAAGARAAAMEEVFRTCDVISIQTPLLAETEKLIGEPLLRLMKPGATFINTSRGAIVDETALIAHLMARPDVDAILDVTDPEPPRHDSALFDLPNVILTPHLAGCYGPECRRLGSFTIDELERWLNHQPLLGAVDRANSLRIA